MNNDIRTNLQRRLALSRHIMRRYFIALFLFISIFCFITFALSLYLESFIWYPDDPLYVVLSFVKRYIIIFMVIPIVLGCIVITHYYMSKPLQYLDQLMLASKQLITDKQTPIVLPADIKNIQDELNSFREEGLRNEQLAKEAEQRKNDLIVYLAHDLKTPLTSVIGYLNLLQDEPDISAETRAKYTNIALEKAQRLEDLINDFFDITRFNLTTLSLEREQTDLTYMLEQIAYEFRPLLAEKDLVIETNLTPKTTLLCDPDKLERVLDNLLRNAINYSYPQTAIQLSMSTTPTDVQIVVSNHGKTIAPEKLNRIFEQFFRLDSSRSTATGGSGLGLAIAKEIVELHGGTITAASENETITFTVLLPHSA